MKKIFKSQINSIIKEFKNTNKKSCFFFGNTSKKENNNFYISEIRENSKYKYAVGVFFNNKSVESIAKIIDGKVDLILVDTEKKVVSKDKSEIVNIEKVVKQSIKSTKVFVYKGNDLTVQAADTFLNNYFLKDIRGLGGKKILILGTGNIGSKLGLKLVESGANVYLHRRNKEKLNSIIKNINIVLPAGTAAKSKKFLFKNGFNKYDVIIGCTDGKPVINETIVKKISPKCIILDIGKGIFTSKGMQHAIRSKLKMFRLDVSPAFNAYLENINSTTKLINSFTQNYRYEKNLKLIQRGILGDKGYVIVDNVQKPRKVYGVTDGFGGIKKVNFTQLQKLKKRILKLK